MKLFAQIRKVDEEKRLVFGRAAEEAVDKSDEIMDYGSSKPHFQKWSADVAADSGGKSLGNVRAMHGKVAAGKLTDIQFDDGAKAIDVVAKVVDDQEWRKVLDGVYTGFSIGGAYVGNKSVEKVDGRDVTRYTARPSEISLVDRPCMPSAKFFEVQKIDGTLAKVEFQPPSEEAEGTVTGTPAEVDDLVKVMAEKSLTLADVIALAKAGNPFAAKPGDKPAADAGEPDADDDAAKKPGPGDAAAAEADPAGAAEAKAAAAAAAEPAGAGPDVPARQQTPAEKAAAEAAKPADKLAKVVDSGELAKMIQEAVAPLQKQLTDAQAAIEPLTKALEVATGKIKRLEEQPAPSRVSLRAVTKGQENGELAKAAPLTIIDDRGEEHVAAGLIKSLHRSGGAPLTKPA